MNTGNSADKNARKSADKNAGKTAGGHGGKTIRVEQTGSPVRRHHRQRETLIGLKLNKIGRVAELPDTPQTRGMVAKVAHLVRVVGEGTISS